MSFNPLGPRDALKNHFTSLKTYLILDLTTKGLRWPIPMKLFYEYMVIFFNLPLTSSHLHPLQAENCDSNSRLVVDEDDNVKSSLKGLNLAVVNKDLTIVSPVTGYPMHIIPAWGSAHFLKSNLNHTDPPTPSTYLKSTAVTAQLFFIQTRVVLILH